MKNKTIAVQTFWRSQINYGQLLQGYALQKFLMQQGYNSYIIRFDSVLSRLKELVILILKRKIISDLKQKKLRKFDIFRKQNIQYSTSKYRSYHSLITNPPKADYYIVGSDQVWAYMRNIERRKGYLLLFGDKNVKKIAYAASFGRDHLQDDSEDFKMALQQFSFLGVREKSGKNICDKLGLESSWVTDPVTLLSVSDWKKLKSSIKLNDKKQNLFFYTLTSPKYNKSYKNLITALQSLYNIHYTNSSELIDENCDLFPSPTEWLAYIDECNFVITDSFHCTMFCIIFNKPFITLIREDGTNMNNRLISMLERLELSNRYVSCEFEKVQSIIAEKINWDRVNNLLNTWVKYSKEQLLTAIKK